MRTTPHIILAAAAVISWASFAAPELVGSGLSGKREKPAVGGVPNVGAQFKAAADAARAGLDANNNTTAEVEIAKAEALALQPEEIHSAATLRLALEERKQNSEGILKALEVLIGSPRTQPGDVARFRYRKGKALTDSKRPVEALPELLKARELGFTDPDMGILIVETYFGNNNIAAAAQEMDSLIKAEEAIGRRAPSVYFDTMITKLYGANERPLAIEWAKRAVAVYPTKENWTRLLAITREVHTFTKIESVAIYRLQAAAGAMATEGDFYDHANVASEAGLPWETIRVILKARTAGVIKSAATSFTKLEASATTSLSNQPSIPALEGQAVGGVNGKPAAQAGDAYLADANFAKATGMYQLALQKGDVNANGVNLNLGMALALSGQKEAAKTALAKVKGGTDEFVASLWRLWVEVGTNPVLLGKR